LDREIKTRTQAFGVEIYDLMEELENDDSLSVTEKESKIRAAFDAARKDIAVIAAKKECKGYGGLLPPPTQQLQHQVSLVVKDGDTHFSRIQHIPDGFPQVVVEGLKFCSPRRKWQRQTWVLLKQAIADQVWICRESRCSGYKC
jgi:hypothetical protein